MARWLRNPFGEWVNIDRYDVVKVTRMYGPIHVMALRGDDHVGLFEAETWGEAQAWLDRLMEDAGRWRVVRLRRVDGDGKPSNDVWVNAACVVAVDPSVAYP